MDGTAGVKKERAKGLEPSTSSLGSSVPVVLDAGNTVFSDVVAEGCTVGCTETERGAEIISRAVELVAALNLSMVESVAVLHHLLRRDADRANTSAAADASDRWRGAARKEEPHIAIGPIRSPRRQDAAPDTGRMPSGGRYSREGESVRRRPESHLDWGQRTSE